METNKHNSIWQRASWFLIFCSLSVIVLVYTKTILVPVCISALLAMLLLPVVNFLEKRMKLAGLAAIILSMFGVLLILSGVVYLLSIQISGFRSDVPLFQTRINDYIAESQAWIQSKAGISDEELSTYLKEGVNSFLGEAQNIVTELLIATTNTLMVISMVVILTFFMLLYRKRIHNYIMMMVPVTKHEQTREVVHEITQVTQQYLSGVILVMFILSILNSILFMILDVPHAIFFAVLAAVLNIVPYVGVWIGTILPVVLLIVTKDSPGSALALLIGIWVNQQIDNNFLTPKITGSKVSLNPLATLLVLIIGGMIWGVAGMVLFIPLLGVLKIIFDNVEELKPMGYLIGEDPSEKKNIFSRWLEKLRNKKK